MSTTYYMLAALIAAAGIPYIVWTRLDARKHRRAKAAHDDLLAMGDDMVPQSLHPEIDLDACIGSGSCERACPEGEIIQITDGRARLVNPLSCIGHSACMQACPVGAIKLVFGSVTRGVELPMLTPEFETSQPGIYIIGELTGMGLIRNAAMQGRQVGETIARSGRRAGAGDADVIVVGAGPAGIAAALGCMAHGLSVRILEQSVFGGTIAHYPRKKIVMTGTLELPGFGTIRKRTMQKEDLLAVWREIRERTNLDVSEGIRVESIRRDGDRWQVIGSDGVAGRSASVVLALGRRGAPRQLGVPGEELHKVAYRLLEPEPFAGKHVMIVGGGNAAADCAIALADSGLPQSVSLSYRRRELLRLRESVQTRLKQLIDDRAITPYLASAVVSIAPEHVTLSHPDGLIEIANDNVIVQIGGTSPSALLRTIGIELVEKRGEA
ncbi:MAG TPA: NAD(P)-binding domain-containing protein [Kofleriaceae bacterium]|jgi:thioredoxin reductase/NAD-dependent dihydropyrimidine dehydrogenase PreA subunit|nr:NAD(P)-binding domain-containing protein [Kofleriaceae bacterium]